VIPGDPDWKGACEDVARAARRHPPPQFVSFSAAAADTLVRLKVFGDEVGRFVGRAPPLSLMQRPAGCAQPKRPKFDLWGGGGGGGGGKKVDLEACHSEHSVGLPSFVPLSRGAPYYAGSGNFDDVQQSRCRRYIKVGRARLGCGCDFRPDIC